MRYSRRISNYSEIIPLCDPTHVMVVMDPMTIGVEKRDINDREKVLFGKRVY